MFGLGLKVTNSGACVVELKVEFLTELYLKCISRSLDIETGSARDLERRSCSILPRNSGVDDRAREVVTTQYLKVTCDILNTSMWRHKTKTFLKTLSIYILAYLDKLTLNKQ